MSGRAQRMEEDVQAVIAACQADQACPFRSESRSKIRLYINLVQHHFALVSRKEHLLALFITNPLPRDHSANTQFIGDSELL